MPSLNTGNAILSNAIAVDSSYNVGIGGAASGSLKLQVTGSDILVNGLTIGEGAGSIGSNTVLGASALPVNTTGTLNTAIGNSALLTNTTGYGNTSVGYSAIGYNTTGFFNGAVGVNALLSNTTGTYNNALGTAALYANTTGSYNTAVGQQAGTANTTGSNNTYIGYSSGLNITTGSNNTIIGNFAGTSALANNIVLADGAGNVRYQWDGTNNVFGNPLSGTSATFSGNVNALNLIATGLYANTWYAGSGSTLALRTAASGVIADFSPTSSNILGFVGINGSTASGAALSVYDQTSGSEQLRLCNSTGSGYWGIGRENNVTGNLYFNSGGNLRVVFTSGGNVGIGTSSPSQLLEVYKSQNASTNLLVRNDNAGASAEAYVNVSNGTYLTSIGTRGTGTAAYNSLDTNSGMLNYNGNTSLTINATDASAVIKFTTNNFTERMRITSGGDVIIGKTSVLWTSVGLQTEFNGRNMGITNNDSSNNLFLRKNDTTGLMIQFWYNSNSVGNVSISTTNTTYTTTSDYRLKEDLQDFNGLDLVSKIKAYDFKWKSENKRMYGVIAHELEEIIDYAVVGKKDTKDMQSVDYSLITPLLVKAIQELNQKVNEQQQTINSLINR